MSDKCCRKVGVQRVFRRSLRALVRLGLKQFLHPDDGDAVSGSHHAVPVHLFLFEDLLFLQLADEGERNPVCLVEEYGILLYQCRGVLQPHVDFPGADRGVPDPEIVHDSAVLALVHLVVDVAGVGKVFLACEVRGSGKCPVVHPFVFEHAVCTEPVVFQCEVP